MTKGGGRRRKPASKSTALSPAIGAGCDWSAAEAQQSEAARARTEIVRAARVARYQKGHVAFDEHVRPQYLAVLEETGSFQAAADAVGINAKTAYNARRADEAFAELCEEALERYRGAIRAEIYRRGVEGWEEPVYQGGVQVGTVRKYSDRMLELEAKRVDPSYRDKVGVEHSGGVAVTAGVLVVGAVVKSTDEWAEEHVHVPPEETKP